MEMEIEEEILPNNEHGKNPNSHDFDEQSEVNHILEMLESRDSIIDNHQLENRFVLESFDSFDFINSLYENYDPLSEEGNIEKEANFKEGAMEIEY